MCNNSYSAVGSNESTTDTVMSESSVSRIGTSRVTGSQTNCSRVGPNSQDIDQKRRKALCSSLSAEDQSASLHMSSVSSSASSMPMQAESAPPSDRMHASVPQRDENTRAIVPVVEATNPTVSPSSLFSRFQALQSQVVDLNRRGMELFSMKKYQSSLFHFNEAFRLITSTGSTLLDFAVDVDPDEFRRIGDDRPNSLFGRKPMPPSDLMMPLEPVSQGVPRSTDDIQGWVLLASMVLMINGSLGHMQRGKLENAEQLLRMAIALSDDEEDRENPDDVRTEEERFELLRRQYHVKMTLMSVYYALGIVQSKPRIDQGEGTEEKLSEPRMRECMVSFTESLSLAGDLLGKHHFTLALIYVTIGQVLLREGYMRGASVSFRHAEDIYNSPRAAISLPLQSQTSSSAGSTQEQQLHDSEPMAHMSDIEVATMLLRCPFSFGAPAA